MATKLVSSEIELLRQRRKIVINCLICFLVSYTNFSNSLEKFPLQQKSPMNHLQTKKHKSSNQNSNQKSQQIEILLCITYGDTRSDDELNASNFDCYSHESFPLRQLQVISVLMSLQQWIHADSLSSRKVFQLMLLLFHCFKYQPERRSSIRVLWQQTMSNYNVNLFIECSRNREANWGCRLCIQKL